MSNQSPYEEVVQQKLNDLPLPNESQSWQAMQHLLDDDKRRGPGGFVKYGGFVLMAISLPLFFWLLLRKNEMQHKIYATAETNTIHTQPENESNNTAADDKKPSLQTNDENENKASQPNEKQANETATSSSETVTNKQANEPKTPTVNDKNGEEKEATANANEASHSHTILRKQKLMVMAKRKIKPAYALAGKTSQLVVAKQDEAIEGSRKESANKSGAKASMNSNQNTRVVSKENALLVTVSADKVKKATEPLAKSEVGKSTTAKEEKTNETADNKTVANDAKTVKPIAKNDSAVTKQTAVASTAKTSQSIKKPKRNGLSLSAGIGIQQQIPIAGQKVVSYGANGNKNIIGDYIPSVYLRAEKPQRWYAQAEFNYGAPQSVDEFAYSRKTLLSDTFSKMTTTTLRLKKTFYHNIPLTFNYYITPHWTVGAGAIYSLLHRSIAEQQVTTKNLQTQTETSAYNIIPSAFSDSFLYKSQWHWLLQTSYEWRRFSFGLRYARDVESYIKYTLPTGEMQERKNWSLELFVRFRLWQSK